MALCLTCATCSGVCGIRSCSHRSNRSLAIDADNSAHEGVIVIEFSIMRWSALRLTAGSSSELCGTFRDDPRPSSNTSSGAAYSAASVSSRSWACHLRMADLAESSEVTGDHVTPKVPDCHEIGRAHV